jgi:nicotinate-nucleotide--dimethylbenzimidazole phosphoribosyltransferase
LPAAVLLFASDPRIPMEAPDDLPSLMAGTSRLNAQVAEAGAELCVIDLGLKQDALPGPGWLSRRARDGSRPGDKITRAEVVRAIETGIEMARDFFAAGNACIVAGVCAAADRAALEEFPVDSADDALDMLTAAAAVDVAALTGCILGSAAQHMPVVLSGPAAQAAIRLAASLAHSAGDACFVIDMASLPDAFANVRRAVRAVGRIDSELSSGQPTGRTASQPPW